MKNNKILLILLLVIIILLIFCYIFHNNSEKFNKIEENELEENIIEENVTKENAVEENVAKEDTIEKSERKIIKKVSPSGFAGSSLHEVRLYDNGDVYIGILDGNDNEENKIVDEELIARNVSDIYTITMDEYENKVKENSENDEILEPGTVVIKGHNIEIIDNGFGWIHFENE